MIQVCVLKSGSEGNCSFISDGETSLLIDAGLLRDEVRKLLHFHGASIYRFDSARGAILLTHEHGDHADGVKSLISRHGMPLYATRGTYAALQSKLNGIVHNTHLVEAGEPFTVGAFMGIAISVKHDAAEPVAYVLVSKRTGLQFGFATDLGAIPEELGTALGSCNWLFLESNHDPAAVLASELEKSRKARVLEGHLANQRVAEFIRKYATNELKYLVLGHVSDGNNSAELVQQTALNALAAAGSQAHLEVVRYGTGSRTYTF